LSYLERLVEDISTAIDDYETYEVVASVSREEWSVFEYLMSFFSSPTHSNSTDLFKHVITHGDSIIRAIEEYYADDYSKV